MRSIKKRLALWHIVVIVGIAALIAIPVTTAHVGSTSVPVVNESPQHLVQQAGEDNINAYAAHSKGPKATVGRRVGRPQEDYYEQRRQYWEKRVDRRLEYRDEYLNEQTGDKDEDADANDSDSKAGKGGDDEDDAVDKDANSDEEIIERRRDYWRQQLDEDW